jgi:predicted esterase
MDWNTSLYKAYIYKGLAFRLHFPKTYNPTVNDGKKYPLLLFFHGHGEYGPITDNEFHLLHGHQGFSDAVNNGTFDGYILSPQSTDFFNIVDYEKLIEIIDYMIQNNKLDPFRITVNGLSQGGEACWEMVSRFPHYIAAASPMSWTQSNYADPAFANKVKFNPVWHFQGSTDINPTPSTTNAVKAAMVTAGAQFKNTEYAGIGHGTWWFAWGEQDFWPFHNRAYSSNPWQLGGRKSLWPGAAMNETIGLALGFSAYEWRKDGVVIPGATSNTIQATAGGVYDARVMRNGVWSDWSRTPVIIRPGRYEAEDYTTMSGVLTENTSDVGGGLNIGWMDQGDWMDYSINPTAAGTYTLRFRIATPSNGGQILVKKGDGTTLATVAVPSTGGWQTWQTISTTVTLATGAQTIRIQSGTTNGWNFNWMEFATGGTPVNQPPTVNAGIDQTITLPTNSVNLTGSASDADGSIASYQWTKITGGQATIASPSTAATSVTGLVQGIYTFRLTATDNNGAATSDTVQVTVNSAANQAPTVNAGADQSITLPSNSVTLTGTATDPDGTIASYLWTKVSGPAATITSPSSASTTITGLVQGSYVFRLTATDNSNASSSDDISVTVNGAAPPPPPPGNTFRIEAENYTNMSGIFTENTQDVDGVRNVGWIDQGDWMDYSVNPSASGTYTINFRVASPYSGAKLLVKKSDGTLLKTVDLPITGGWQAWQTVSTTIALTSGVQTLRIESASGAGWNFNWMEFTTGGSATPPATAIPAKIEAENYTTMNGVLTENTSDVGGGKNIGWVDMGDWMDFAINAPSAGTYTLKFRIATPYSGAQIQVKNGSGTVLSTVNLPITGGFQTWQTVSSTLNLPAGVQTIRLQSNSSAGWNINWIEFVQGTGTITSTQSSIQDVTVASAQKVLLEVYPNPVKDQFTLNIQNEYKGALTIILVNMNGGVQKQWSYTKNADALQVQLSASELAPGQYMLIIKSKDGQQTRKFIKR